MRRSAAGDLISANVPSATTRPPVDDRDPVGEPVLLQVVRGEHGGAACRLEPPGSRSTDSGAPRRRAPSSARRERPAPGRRPAPARTSPAASGRGKPAVTPVAQFLETGHVEQSGDRQRSGAVAAEHSRCSATVSVSEHFCRAFLHTQSPEQQADRGGLAGAVRPTTASTSPARISRSSPSRATTSP